jgi:hypothetical protein
LVYKLIKKQLSKFKLLSKTLRKIWFLLPMNSHPREQILALVPKNSICAEIGVWKGAYSKKILKITKPNNLHLIDPWKFLGQFPGRWYGGSIAKDQTDMDVIFRKVQNSFRNYDNVIINRGESNKILLDFPDSYFDWIYIDGNHEYEYVLEDLKLSYEKVKPNGFILGDDYNWEPGKNYPVKKAVNDFLKLHNLDNKLQVIGSQFIIRLS